MNLSQEIEKIVKQTIQDYFASQKQIALNGDVNIEVTLDVKPMTGGIAAIRDGKPITGDRLIADTEIKASKITENLEAKKPKIKYHPLPTYIGELPINITSNFLDEVKYRHFIGSDVVLELDDGQEITIPYKEQYNDNTTLKEYVDRSIAHAYAVLKKGAI